MKIPLIVQIDIVFSPIIRTWSPYIPLLYLPIIPGKIYHQIAKITGKEYTTITSHANKAYKKLNRNEEIKKILGQEPGINNYSFRYKMKKLIDNYDELIKSLKKT